MDFSKQYGSLDPKQSAKWFELDGSKFLIAPANNIAFKNKTLETFKISQVQNNGIDDLTAKTVVELESKIKVGTVLLDWESVQNQGQPYPFNEDNAVKMLVVYEQFRNWVDSKASELANTTSKIQDSKKKN